MTPQQAIEKINREYPSYAPKLWEKHGKTRVYLDAGRKDVKMFLDFTDTSISFNIFIEDCGQHANWYQGQRAKIYEYTSKLRSLLGVA